MKKILSILLIVILMIGLIGTPALAATPADIADSIEDGIAWLVSVQNGDGSWGPAGGDRFGTTGLVLVKLQDRAFELGYDGPFDDDYPLKANVVNGLNYLLPLASTTAISMQLAGDPDTDGDGDGISVNGRTYDTAILMMALAAGRDPNQIVAGGPLVGKTYGEVLQDLSDWMSYAQSDGPPYVGGWSYSAISGGSSGDQSNAGYAVLGLLYATESLYGYNCNVPGWVKTQLNLWIDYIQNDQGIGDNSCGGATPDPDGGSGYENSCRWVNSLKTGNLLTQMAYFGDTAATVRVGYALDYLARHWTNDWETGWQDAPQVQYQATYCIMKGLQAMGIPHNGLTGIADWYDDMATAIIAQQDGAGWWPSSPAYVWYGGGLGHMVSKELSTAWALLMIEKFAPPVIPTPEPGPEVGGTVQPINKLVLLTPMIALGILLAAWGTLILRRRRAQS